MLDSKQKPAETPSVAVPTLRRFSYRLSHSNLRDKTTTEENLAVEADPAFQEYVTLLKSIRGNEGQISRNSYQMARAAVRRFLRYTDIPVTDKALSGLVTYKKANPQSTEIEQALRAFSNEQPIKASRVFGSRILGIFRANYAQLSLRIDNHFAPTEENCTPGIFREIFSKLTDEQKAMIQWAVFFPERATAAYRTPLNEIDLSRSDFAVIRVKAHSTSYNNKSKVEHPAFIPIWFAKPIVEQARQMGRKCPFPNHEQEWRKVTKFAKNEFGVRLVSNYTRKYFEYIASESTLRPAYAAYLMADKTKLNATGHLPQFYNIGLRFIEELVRAYKESGIEHKLRLISISQPGGASAPAVGGTTA